MDSQYLSRAITLAEQLRDGEIPNQEISTPPALDLLKELIMSIPSEVVHKRSKNWLLNLVEVIQFNDFPTIGYESRSYAIVCLANKLKQMAREKPMETHTFQIKANASVDVKAPDRDRAKQVLHKVNRVYLAHSEVPEEDGSQVMRLFNDHEWEVIDEEAPLPNPQKLDIDFPEDVEFLYRLETGPFGYKLVCIPRRDTVAHLPPNICRDRNLVEDVVHAMVRSYESGWFEGHRHGKKEGKSRAIRAIEEI